MTRGKPKIRARDAGPIAGLLGEGAVFKGTLNLDADYRVDGHVFGSVTSSATLFVGSRGRVTTDALRARGLSVGGRVTGTLFVGERLEILPGGVVLGRVVMGRAGLSIEPGGAFLGTLDMREEPPGTS